MIILVRNLVAVLLFILFIITFLVFSICTFRRWNLDLSGPILRGWGRATLWILGITLEIEGVWPFEVPAPRVTVMNHQSTLDIVWFSAIAPNRMGGIGKKELRWVPFLNIAWWALHMHYIDRSNHDKALLTMKMVGEELVRHRRTVGISPEGTRSEDGSIAPFKKGAFHLALTHQLPIYPIIVSGPSKLMPKGSFLAKSGTIKIKFLEPISTKAWTRNTLSQEIEQLHERFIHEFNNLTNET